MQNLVFSCDWGTSAFRLKLVDRQTKNIVSELNSDQGTAFLHNLWKQQKSIGQKEFYLEKLKTSISLLSANAGQNPDHIPIVISGMASSSIGLQALPYARLPFSLDGNNARVEKITDTYILNNEIWLISGVCSENDVMRGEETQMVGIATLLRFAEDEESICILPGTHSKHILLKKSGIYDFKTFLTGELFDLIRKHSVISQSVSSPEPDAAYDTEELSAFKTGIRKSGESTLLNTLFSVRTNQLLNDISKVHNFYFLSGLLIGTELRTLNAFKKIKITLCSGSNVNHLYQIALQELDLYKNTYNVPSETMENAAMLGQIKILEKQRLISFQ
jgi:2-dehydro-3-deoxygalactonokinase